MLRYDDDFGDKVQTITLKYVVRVPRSRCLLHAWLPMQVHQGLVNVAAFALSRGGREIKGDDKIHGLIQGVVNRVVAQVRQEDGLVVRQRQVRNKDRLDVTR